MLAKIEEILATGGLRQADVVDPIAEAQEVLCNVWSVHVLSPLLLLALTPSLGALAP
jgi:hypothetical protein